MYKKPKLSVEDFYHQFHNFHHHKDSGEYHREVSHRRRKKGPMPAKADGGAIDKGLALAAKAIRGTRYL
jgi:hypothetical protein